ncbi:universal stress protein [Alteribacter natronophilus]|uniref:universal stress protein n=1 Tax=Alteribacter natronophilus TaxID=2583810 RepID=UPI00110D38C5|nr:universal stress protein [Alteribacter natronophilus]TMW71722.1 universal stress protein [Alteribacter natronophilus]
MRGRYENILVAVDGSDEAKRAMRKAADMAAENGSTLYIAHIIDTRTFASVEHYDRTIVKEAEDYANAMLREYQENALEAGVENVKLLTDYGSPKVKIAKDIASDNSIDLIVTGATGLNAVERFLIGSVSEYITRHASCDVLIVRNEPSAR